MRKYLKDYLKDYEAIVQRERFILLRLRELQQELPAKFRRITDLSAQAMNIQRDIYVQTERLKEELLQIKRRIRALKREKTELEKLEQSLRSELRLIPRKRAMIESKIRSLGGQPPQGEGEQASEPQPKRTRAAGVVTMEGTT